MKNIFWSFFWPLVGHLFICFLVTEVILELIIPAISGSAPYLIIFDACFCLGIMSIWYASSFDLDSWHIGAYLAVTAMLVLIFLFSLFDWILGFNLIPAPWRYIAVFETLPLASLFVSFLVIIAAGITFWPTRIEHSGQRQPA